MTDIYVGTYAKPGGQGFYPLTLATGGAMALGECVAPAHNSSFGAYSTGNSLHYLTDECDGRIGLWQLRPDGWQEVISVSSCGKEPCYLALDPTGSRLAVANYGSGSVALFHLDSHGLPIAPPTVFQGSGSGPVADRQEGPHMHCVRFAPDGAALYAVNLGADHVLRFALDRDNMGDPVLAYHAPPGSGPRHLLLHPERPFALLLSELASTLTLLAVQGDALEPLATCSTLPNGWSGENLGGHLEWPATGRAYVSNRGHDSIALLDVDLDQQTLEVRQHIPSGGESPRHFLLLEDTRQLVVAHEKDGVVATFGVAADGTLAPTDHSVRVPGACFLFRP
jgi:6-phosphogluconolactonase